MFWNNNQPNSNPGSSGERISFRIDPRFITGTPENIAYHEQERQKEYAQYMYQQNPNLYYQQMQAQQQAAQQAQMAQQQAQMQNQMNQQYYNTQQQPYMQQNTNWYQQQMQNQQPIYQVNPEDLPQSVLNSMVNNCIMNDAFSGLYTNQAAYNKAAAIASDMLMAQDRYANQQMMMQNQMGQQYVLSADAGSNGTAADDAEPDEPVLSADASTTASCSAGSNAEPDEPAVL